MRIGVVEGMRWIFAAEFHFWWQRKENGARAGRV